MVNGLWSGRGARDLSSLFVRNFVASKTFKAPASAARTRDDGGHDVPTPASNEAMRILRNKADAASPPIYTMAGGQRNCLFRNNGDGTFTEVGYLAGVDRVEDGYVACVADYNKDGRADLFLRNADPGTRSHTFPPVVLLENRSTNGNRSLEVSLRGDGRKSNRDAVGAVVEITVNGRRQVRSIMTVSGAAMGETTAFFGLGPEGVAEGMRVRWPSGRVQDFRGVAAGRVSLVEAGGLQRL